METKNLGRTDEKIPEIGQGTWNYQGDVAPLRTGISLGASLIDTAEIYGTEEMVGRAIHGLDGVFIATKVAAQHLRHDDVIRAAEQSLKRLKLKTLDLYQIHWPNPRISIRETMQAMEELVKGGKVRYIGVSNFSAKQTKEAQQALSSQEIVSNQVEYSLLEREIETELLPYCVSQKITIIAYTPLAHGHLASGRDARSSLLDSIARKYGRTRPQVALNWLTYNENVIVIPKAERLEHVEENCGASGWRLTKEDYETISSKYT